MAAVQRLITLPAETPSLRLLADQTANVLTGMAQALNGLALLVDDPARRVPRRGSLRLRVPDWLPALVNGARAFAAIGAVALFWIVTEWPSGASAISFTAIIVICSHPGVPLAPALGIDLARFPPPRSGSHISRLVRSHWRPPRDNTGRSNTAAARSCWRRCRLVKRSSGCVISRTGLG